MTTCRVCAEPFEKQRMGQIVCGLACARKVPVINRKAEKAETRKRKEAAKQPKTLKAEAQAAFNKYVRLRDAGKGCIDCGQQPEPDKLGGSSDAGHYRSVGSAPHLRFDERNCHLQRKNCNRPGGTTPAKYRAGLVARIGLAAVEALEADQSVKKYTADDFRAIRDLYRQKLRELQA